MVAVLYYDTVARAPESTRIARMMGLPKAARMSDLGLVEKVENGLPLSAVERVALKIDPHDKGLKYQIVSRASFSRLQKAEKPRLSRELSERVYALARVVAEAALLWQGDDGALHRFLNRPHPLLDGRSPFDVAKESSAGAELVVKLMGRARAGVAV